VKPTKTLIFIPTYNERDNAPRMCAEIHELGLDADVLFVDDNSPDGTGDLLEGLKERFPRLIVQHRTGKLGIGSAHFDAIEWAYDQGYNILVTMDCDFTHSPADIPAMIGATANCDVSIGSRWLRRNSLPGWNLFRRMMTNMGHWLTRRVLGVPQDASGGFRGYRLDRLPRQVFRLVKSRGYAFFFESLFVLNRNRFSITEVPIVLPARTYGHSKMSSSAAMRSAWHVFELWFANLRRPEQFLVERVVPQLDPTLVDPQGWDSYWSGANPRKTGDDSPRNETAYEGTTYDLIAGVYRRMIIKRNLTRAIQRVFPAGAVLLHAGCGSGQVDTDLQATMRITALDISPGALRLYARNNPQAAGIRHGSIFHLPFPAGTFDGIYNLGVMEHFTRDEIAQILTEFGRVLRPHGRIVLFWPHARASSVFVLRAVHFVMNRMMKSEKKLHPAEISHIQSRKHARTLLSGSGFDLADYRFGINDLFVQAVIVGQKSDARPVSQTGCQK
jgi:dolichol-phosphate mannosyltransferase